MRAQTLLEGEGKKSSRKKCDLNVYLLQMFSSSKVTMQTNITTGKVANKNRIKATYNICVGKILLISVKWFH